MIGLFLLLRNLFAVLGVVLALAAAYFYAVGREAIGPLDPKAAQVLSEFGRRALQTDVATASVIKIPLTEGVKISQAIESMKLRANKHNIKLAYVLRRRVQTQKLYYRQDTYVF